jgi:hypothetical protein
MAGVLDEDVAPAVSFDHLVGSSDQRGRHCEAERLGGLEVDHQLDLVGACTGKSAGFSPLRMRSTWTAARRNSSR